MDWDRYSVPREMLPAGLSPRVLLLRVRQTDETFESWEQSDQDRVDEDREQQDRIHDEGSMPSGRLISGNIESQERLNGRASEVRSGRSGSLPT